MKRYPGIDYDYRPVSYWNDETLAQAILKNVKGELRREKIRQALAEGSIEDIPEDRLGESLVVPVGDRTIIVVDAMVTLHAASFLCPDKEASTVSR